MSDATGNSNGSGPGGALRGEEALELSARLSGLARAGLPLASSLSAMAEELPRGRLRRAMVGLAAELESGRALEEALDDRRSQLPPHLRGLVAAGMRSGRLGEVLGDFSQFTTVGVELRRRLRLNLAYPAISLLITIGVFAFVGLAVVPQFESIFADFGIPLPGMTIAIIVLARGMIDFWETMLVLTGLAVALVVGGYLFLPTALMRGLAGRVPIVGGCGAGPRWPRPATGWPSCWSTGCRCPRPCG